MSIKILLADNHKFSRQALSVQFEQTKGIVVIAEADKGYKLFELLQMHSPHIIIFDVDMDGQRGLEILKEVIKRYDSVLTIAYSENNNEEMIKNFFRHGGHGYLLKSCPFEELLTAIRTVYEGDLHLCPDLGGLFMRDILTNSPPPLEPALLKKLSIREIEVLKLIIEGKTVKEIAALLNISSDTAKTHKKHIMEKLEVHSTLELIRKTIFGELD
jgi:DNA-binding NarL/FixJ family response regulator